MLTAYKRTVTDKNQTPMPRHQTHPQKPTIKPVHGMSWKNSTLQQRGDFIAKMHDDVLTDCLEYGFYMGEHWPDLIPDYNGDGVRVELATK